jgi:hypothetical protein
MWSPRRPLALHRRDLRVPAHRDAEYERLVAELEEAGIVYRFTDDEGRESIGLTREDAALGRTLAMTADDDARLELLEQLLG